jgi:hypothetical protein
MPNMEWLGDRHYCHGPVENLDDDALTHLGNWALANKRRHSDLRHRPVEFGPLHV